MRFHGDDVGLTRRFDDAERNRFGDRDNQHRSMLVRDFGDGIDVFDSSEEIRRLNQDAGCLGRDRLLEFLEIDAAIVGEPDS